MQDTMYQQSDDFEFDQKVDISNNLQSSSSLACCNQNKNTH